jgi:hypothetical protein
MALRACQRVCQEGTLFILHLSQWM